MCSLKHPLLQLVSFWLLAEGGNFSIQRCPSMMTDVFLPFPPRQVFGDLAEAVKPTDSTVLSPAAAIPACCSVCGPALSHTNVEMPAGTAEQPAEIPFVLGAE